MFPLRPLAAAALICALPLAVHAASERQRVDTRFGPVEVRGGAGSSQIVVKGQVVSSVPSVGAALYRVSPRNEREFVIVEVALPTARCSHSFVFLEVFANGTAKASQNFGECQELRAVEFNAQGSPFLRLKDASAAGASATQGAADFVWKDGQLSQVAGSAASNAASAQAIAAAASAAPASAPALAVAATVKPAASAKVAPVSAAAPATVAAPVAAAAPVAHAASVAVSAPPAAAAPHAAPVVPPVPAAHVSAAQPAVAAAAKAAPVGCEAAASAANSEGQAVARSSSMRQVGGSGRLQFYTAPAAGCAKRGLFVVTGDLLDAYTVYQDYTFVHYVNPKSGRTAEGWVQSARLVSPGRDR